MNFVFDCLATAGKCFVGFSLIIGIFICLAIINDEFRRIGRSR